MNKNKISLSIIVPIYNVENYVPRLINCLKNQTNKNFEVVFVDDGSTDESYRILLEESKKIVNEYRIIQKKNGGLSSARNIGLKNATRNYVFFMDSDDEISFDFVDKILSTVSSNNFPDTIIYDYSSIDEGGKVVLDGYGHGEIYKIKDTISNEIALRELSKDSIPITAWSFVTKKSLLLENNIYFSEGKKFEDTNFTPKVFYYSRSINLIPEKLYKYRQRIGSIMNLHSIKDADDAIFVTKDLWFFALNTKDQYLMAVVGRSVYATLSAFLSSPEVYDEVRPILLDSRRAFLKQNLSKLKWIKMYLFQYYLGYKFYSKIKRNV